MKTQKTIFNVIALISIFAVVAPALAMDENLQFSVEGASEAVVPVTEEVINTVADMAPTNTVSEAADEAVEVFTQEAAALTGEIVAESLPRSFDAADFHNNLRQSFDNMAPAQKEIPGIPAAITLGVEKPQGYATLIGSRLKSYGGSATSAVYNGALHGGSVSYNAVVNNPKTSAAVVAGVLGLGLVIKYRTQIKRDVNPFSWFGKKAVSPAVSGLDSASKTSPSPVIPQPSPVIPQPLLPEVQLVLKQYPTRDLLAERLYKNGSKYAPKVLAQLREQLSKMK